MNDYTVSKPGDQAYLIAPDGKIIAAFGPTFVREDMERIVFCLNMGCDVMTHLVECEDGGPTLEDVVFARVDKGMKVAR